MPKKILYATLLLALFSMHPAQAQTKDQIPTLSVSGTGTQSVAPDMAIVSVGVLREAKTARKALSKNNDAMSEILGALKAKGIAERDLQTSNFNIQPRYVYPKNPSNGVQKPPRIVGYVVSNNLNIRIRDLASTGEILDQLVTLGVNTGGNIQFTNDDPTDILRTARENAVKDAMAKAQTLVDTAGVQLGKILSMNENTNRPRPVGIVKAQRMAVESADAVPVASGENTYRVNVNIVWEISQ